MKLLDRSPKGKFIGSYEALAYWLPELLKRSWQSPLETMLKTAAAWCDSEAAGWYRNASDALLGKDGFADGQEHAEYCARRAAEWFERKRILEQARVALEAIR